MHTLTAPDHAALAYDAMAPFYDDFTAHHDYEGWVAILERLVLEHGLAGRRLLDVACGTGKSTAPFLARGYRVTGCDGSGGMLARARGRLGAGVPLHQRDLRDLGSLGSFDLVCCIDDSLNYLLEPGDLDRAFRAVHRHLASGAPFVFDMNAVRALEAGMFNQHGTGKDADLEYHWDSAWDPLSKLCTIHMEFHVRVGAEDWQCLQETHVQRGYTLPEITGGLRSAGFEVLTVYDAFTTHRPTAKSDRYHVAARKL